MKLQSLLCFLLLWIGTAITSFAQWPMTFEDNLMFTQVGLEHNGQQRQVRALIDTGCSFCSIDSTYAVDSLGIDISTCKTTWVNSHSVSVLETYIDHIDFCDAVYEKMRCSIVNMKIFGQDKPLTFIVGADVLKRKTLLFDLKEREIHQFNVEEKHPDFDVFHWKSHQQMKHVPYDAIMIKGKIAERAMFFQFDTGSKINTLPTSSGIEANDTTTRGFSSLGHPKEHSLQKMVRQGEVFINNELQALDFYFDSTFTHGFLSLEFMHNRSFALDYKHRRLYIQKEYTKR